MAKQFLDKDGLDIVAEQINLKPSTFTGTTQEWEDVTDKSKYEIVNLTDDISDASEVVRNPDWSRVVDLTNHAFSITPYIVPEDGLFIVCRIRPVDANTISTMSVNNVPFISVKSPLEGSDNTNSNTCINVSKGDSISIDNPRITDPIYFVPYKTSIIDNRILLNYSTSEQFTGKYWIDGKKIYQKVLTGTTSSQGNTFPSNTNSVNIPIGALTETIIDYKVKVNKTDTGISLKDGEILTNLEFVAAWSRNNSHTVNPNTIAVSVGTGLTSLPIVCVVEYTKTTD